MRKVWIVKANGNRAWYNRKAIYKSCRRSGSSPQACNAAIDKVERVLRDGMHTQDILKAVLQSLNKQDPAVAPRYDLKGALMRLGPAGFNFEQLTAELLQKYGYSTTTNAKLQGACVEHEVDIIAIKNKKCHLIECKFHRQSGTYTGLKTAMYTWARLEDLNQGYKQGKCDKFHKAWLVSNTKFSTATKQYATCKGMLLTGWRTPEGESYAELLENKNLYPITTLHMDHKTLAKFANAKIMFLRDLCELTDKDLQTQTGLSKQRLTKLKMKASEILDSCKN